MNEPTLTTPNENGRPEYSDEQYSKWLDDMRPFLRQGCSLYYAMDKAGLLTHMNSIYRKYRLNDWFCQKIDGLRATIGELTNNLVFKVIEKAHTRMVETDGNLSLTDNEVKIVKIVAEKHRAAQPFFVNRTETADADDTKLGKIIETLDNGSDYDDVAREAEKQMVAPNASVQDQGQAGANSNVQAQPSTAQASNGTPEPSAQ